MCFFSRVLTLAPRARFGQGRDPIWLDDLRCPTNASTLAECSHRGWGSHNCRHSEDMGLICATDDHVTSYPNVHMSTAGGITEQTEGKYGPTTASYECVAGLQNAYVCITSELESKQT